MKTVLIIVDVQNDFCPGGRLAVTEGNLIVHPINKMMEDPKFNYIVATQDWHPQNHSSFVSNNPEGGTWPDHCVQGTNGAEMHSALHMSKVDEVFRKGTNPEVDSYSGFFDNDRKSETGLRQWLLDRGVTHVVVVGLALDYCVKATAEDAHRLGFNTSVILPATRAVNIKATDGAEAIESLKASGITLVNSL